MAGEVNDLGCSEAILLRGVVWGAKVYLMKPRLKVYVVDSEIEGKIVRMVNIFSTYKVELETISLVKTLIDFSLFALNLPKVTLNAQNDMKH